MFTVPKRDDLRFKAIAKYRLIRDGDICQYEGILNEELDQPHLRGVACDAKSIEEFETFKVNKMYESENLSVGDSYDFEYDSDEFEGKKNPKRWVRNKPDKRESS